MKKKNKIIAVLQARTNSSRLPKKVLKKINNVSVVEFMITRLKRIEIIDEIWIATTNSKKDNIIEKKFNKIAKIFRGDEKDVLGRYYELSLISNPKVIIRLTADCPFIDSNIIKLGIKKFLTLKVDYLSNVLDRTYPDGLDFEIFNFKTLKETEKNCKDISVREHVTPYMKTDYYKKIKTGLFKTYNLKNEIDFSHFRLTLDTEEDYLFLKNIAKNLGSNFSWMEVIRYLTQNPQLLTKKFITKRVGALSRHNKIKNLNIANYKFGKSNKYFEKVKKIIPLGTQTFSKSFQQYVKGAAPLFAENGKGAYLYDIDKNNYIDYVMGLLPIIIGYADKDINNSIKSQLEKGITFSLASKLEYQLAKKLKQIIPCAEMVRYGKNGSDATSAAVRLARYYTGRKKILIAGYHGWHDWYIGSTTRDKGVPNEIKKLTDKVASFDLKAFKKRIMTSDYAAFIIEPYADTNEEKNYLKEVRRLTSKYRTLLVFDEIISGFRINIGGAQKEYNIVPDLATFGKSVANGMPLSIIAGKSKIMKGMNEIFFSTTFGGEALSIVAAISTIQKIEKLNISYKIKVYGKKLIEGLNEVISDNNLSNYIKFKGPYWWPRLNIKNTEMDQNLFKSLLRQELNACGLLINATLNISYAHCNEMIYNQTISRYNLALRRLNKILRKKNPKKELKGELIKPTFKVRD